MSCIRVLGWSNHRSTEDLIFEVLHLIHFSHFHQSSSTQHDPWTHDDGARELLLKGIQRMGVGRWKQPISTIHKYYTRATRIEGKTIQNISLVQNVSFGSICFLVFPLPVLDIMPTNHPFHVANLIIHILGHIFDSWSSRGKERVTSTTSQEPKVPDK